ncbi:MAG: patatin-like phospholipase family protein [Planctomycetota bacterium]
MLYVPRPAGATVTLGGGGARGIAHLGVLQMIDASELRVKHLVGVSMGSLVGGMYAAEPDADALRSRAIEFLESQEFDRRYTAMLNAVPHLAARKRQSSSGEWYSWIRTLILTGRRIRTLLQGNSVMSNDFLAFAIENLVPDIRIEDTEVPITILAAELRSGMPVALESGSLREAILASSSIPGVFPPIPWGEMLLCDLGILNSLPIEIARAYADEMMIGVDVAGAVERSEKFNHAVDIMIRMDEIGERMSRRQSAHRADLIIRPSVSHHGWFDFREPQRLIQAGRTAGGQSLRCWLNDRRREESHSDGRDIAIA